MLSVDDRPQWYVIDGGSSRYVDKLIRPYKDRIRVNCPVQSIRRFESHVEIGTEQYGQENFDAVFIASHSDQALAMLSDASAAEKDILGAIPYQRNEAVLHTDQSLLPKRKLAWAAWNYHIVRNNQSKVALTYNMNMLQGLDAKTQFLVTLNNTSEIDPDKIIKTIEYSHPMFTLESAGAQRRYDEISGTRRTYYCGAYWRNGFHEDGVFSALSAVRKFEEVQHEQLHLRRAG
jgi:predicted NAD/FAD-binding protein